MKALKLIAVQKTGQSFGASRTPIWLVTYKECTEFGDTTSQKKITAKTKKEAKILAKASWYDLDINDKATIEKLSSLEGEFV